MISMDQSTFVVKINLYLVTPILLGWAWMYIFTQDVQCHCDHPTGSNIAACQRIFQICSGIRTRKIWPGFNYSDDESVSPGLLPLMNEPANNENHSTCHKGYEQEFVPSSPLNYFPYSFPFILCLHAIFIVCSSKCLLWFENQSEPTELAGLLQELVGKDLEDKGTLTAIKRLVGKFYGNFKFFGARSFWLEGFGTILAWGQFCLIWWFSNGDKGIWDMAHEVFSGIGELPGSLETSIYNPFPRALNCSFHFPKGPQQAFSCADGLYTICFKLNNFTNQLMYLCLMIWFLTVIAVVLIRQFHTSYFLLVAATKIAVLKRYYMSWQFLPGNMHAYSAPLYRHRLKIEKYSEMEFVYFLRLQELVGDLKVTQKFVDIYIDHIGRNKVADLLRSN